MANFPTRHTITALKGGVGVALEEQLGTTWRVKDRYIVQELTQLPSNPRPWMRAFVETMKTCEQNAKVRALLPQVDAIHSSAEEAFDKEANVSLQALNDAYSDYCNEEEVA